MKTKLLLISMAIGSIASAQSLLWAKSIGGATSDIAFSIAVDTLSNVYTTGVFRGGVDFDPGSGSISISSAFGNESVFISKLDVSGNYVWAGDMGGANVDVGHSLAVDTMGNVYATGMFQATADLDPFATIANLTSAGGNDAYVTKTGSAGPTGIKEAMKPTAISIYPNPFSHHALIITDKSFKDATVTITNALGDQVQIIKNISGSSIDLNRENLKSGIYFVRVIEDNNIISTDKVVITD